MMRQITVMIVLAVLLSGCSPVSRDKGLPGVTPEEDPIEVVRSFYQYVEERDPEKVLTFFGTEGASYVQREPDNTGIPGNIYYVTKTLRDTEGSIKFTSSRITLKRLYSGRAEVHFEAEAEMVLQSNLTRFTLHDIVSLSQHNGRWLIRNIERFRHE